MMKLLALVGLAMAAAAKNAPTPLTADCWKKPTVLKDVAAGWGDECKGLTRVLEPGAVLSDWECEAKCVADVKCAVWQYTDSDECWMGVPLSACRTREGFKAKAGQRIQHGDIIDVTPALGQEVMNLMAFKMETGTEVVDEVRCRDQCYSDTTCTVWQFSEQTATKGCWVEHYNPTRIQQPREIKKDSQFSKDVKFGEFVTHICPAKPEEPFDWTWVIVGAVIALLGLAILCYMLQKKPKVKKTRAVKIEAKPEPAPVYFVPQPTVLLPQTYQSVPMTMQPMAPMVQQPLMMVR